MKPGEDDVETQAAATPTEPTTREAESDALRKWVKQERFPLFMKVRGFLSVFVFLCS